MAADGLSMVRSYDNELAFYVVRAFLCKCWGADLRAGYGAIFKAVWRKYNE